MLSLTNKNWIVADPPEDKIQSLSRELGIPPLAARFLLNRKIDTPEAGRFIVDTDLSNLHDPFLMLGMSAATDRIVRAIQSGEVITAFADYDVDGVTSAALLTHFFRDLGVSIRYYLPERLEEGYGLNEMALSKIHAGGSTLVITADCGITAVKELQAAKALGLDIIVTDHHQLGEDGLPDAVAVLNPHQPGCAYPFRFLSGVGIVFKLATAVRTALHRAGWNKNKLPNLRQYLDLFALGTIADVAPLVGENHVLTGHGLDEMTITRKPGLVALKNVTKVNGNVDSRSVGFVLGPRLNAAGRLGKADAGLHLLVSNDMREAMDLAKTLDDVNIERQEIQKWTQEEAEYLLEREVDFAKSKVIVLASENFHRGVVGIVASRLIEKYYRPTILIALKDGIGQGSGRSIPKFNLFKAMRDCSGYLLKFGGHAYAAGLTIQENRIPAFRDAINALGHRYLTQNDMTPELRIDAILELADITPDRYREIQMLKPFGEGNSIPLFASRGVTVRGIRFMGAEGKHVRFRASQNNCSLDVVAFNKHDLFEYFISENAFVDIAYQIRTNNWSGQEKLEIDLLDIRLAGK